MELTQVARRLIAVPAAACALAAIPATAAAASGAHLASGKRTAAAAPAAVPKGFRASAMTWTSATRGWVLGTELCGPKYGNCRGSQVIGTTNGGNTWHLVGRLTASIPKLGAGGKGITEIRFGTRTAGWAFGPDLYRTVDGGKSWKSIRIPGGDKQVLDLAVTPRSVYAIVSPCGFGAGICKGRLTAWRARLTGTRWTRMAFPRALHVNVSADVAAYRGTVYVIDPPEGRQPAQFYASTHGGRHFRARRNPCPALTLHTLIQAAPTSATKVALLCDGNAGFGKSVKSVYVSRSTGKKDIYAGTMSPWGIQAQLTASPSGNLAVAAWSIGSFIDINDTKGGTTWHQVIGSGDGGAGFNDIAYVSDKVAWVVGSPASMFPAHGVLFKTTDAGRHWHLAKF
jgi:photosystem II stability/assembly factor-like uncharacterized protein